MNPHLPTTKHRTLIPVVLLLVTTALNLTTPPPKAADANTDQHIPFPDERLTVSGLAWFSEDAPVLRRLPARLKESFRPAVWSQAQQPSGGRIRFATDSRTIAVAARNPDTSTMHHMTLVGQSGLDLYVNGRYLNSAWPDKEGRIAREWTVGEDRIFREITLYLPLYKGIALEEIVIEPGSTLRPATPFSQIRPVVYYGSSITQGGCAENPGLSYQAIVSRRLNVDFINLGFSGNGLGDPDVATAIAEIDASCFVLDYWANPSPEVYRQTLPGFVQTLRAKHPQTPILIPGPYYFPAEAVDPKTKSRQEEKRTIAREFVKARREAGDSAIAFVDGFGMLSPDQVEGLVDGVHANSIGFYFCANGLEPHLRKALRLQDKP
ncbi:MAG: SGNH/GDSL hydrolase family protein [Verrucomicrobia bacterium]|nr:SGNH/GDSL hydrolase family protein [Verrucomicrobiota bacterium]